MEVTINGERTRLPDDSDLTLGETELVAKHLDIDLGSAMASQSLMGLVFIALYRKDPDGAIVDKVDAVRKMTVKSLEVKKEDDVSSVPLSNGRSSLEIPEPYGHPA